MNWLKEIEERARRHSVCGNYTEAMEVLSDDLPRLVAAVREMEAALRMFVKAVDSVEDDEAVRLEIWEAQNVASEVLKRFEGAPTVTKEWLERKTNPRGKG